MTSSAERQRDIEQGLRAPNGSLTFSLVAEEYIHGFADFEAGNPPPKFTSASYDLGRRKAVRDAEDRQRLAEQLRKDREHDITMMRELLADRPDILTEYLSRIGADA